MYRPAATGQQAASQLKEKMQTYIGTKIIKAEPMTRLAYNQYRGWELPADENGDDEGFLVEYVDGGKANVPGRAGYVSWSPKDVFERAYREFDGDAGVARAMGEVRTAIQVDPEYAWSWHCNIAMASVDEGMEHGAANRAAARFMDLCFGVDTSKNRHYSETVDLKVDAGA